MKQSIEVIQENKILMLITNLGKGGAQRVFYDHAVSFNTRYRVAEAVFNKSEDERIYNSDLPLYSLEVQKGKNLFAKGFNILKRATELKRIISKRAIRLTISHMDGANWVNVLSRTGEKKILVVHGTVLHDHSQSKLIQLLRKKILIPCLYNKATVTVTVSEGIKHELTNYCGVHNVIAIPNFFDIAAIEERAGEPLSPIEEAIFAQYKTIITSGRFHEQKKQEYLLPIFQQVRQCHPDSKLILLGDGELRKQLIHKAAQLGFRCFSVWDEKQVLSEHFDVYFLGYKENPFAYLSRSSLFVFPSGWEGFPMALCEAMICGVPVVTTDCPTGPREILAPGTFDARYQLKIPEWTKYGVLMPMHDKRGFIATWVDVVCRLLPDGQKRAQLSVAGKERMKAFDKSAVMEKWYGLIDSLLGK